MWHLLNFQKKLMIRHNKIYRMIGFFTYFHYFILFWGTIFWHNITEKYCMIWYLPEHNICRCYLTKTSIINLKEFTVDSINCFCWESNPSIGPQKYSLDSFNEYQPVGKTLLKDSQLSDFSQWYKVSFYSAILAGPNLDRKKGHIFTTCLSLNYY